MSITVHDVVELFETLVGPPVTGRIHRRQLQRMHPPYRAEVAAHCG